METPPQPPLDRADPEGAIAAAAAACSNKGRWGAEDVLGTMNFLTDAKRREGAALVQRGASFSLAQRFDTHGPQRGWRRRTNPVHTMLDTGLDAERGQGFPHGLGGADDVVFMPLQCSTQWDGLGHIFDHGVAYNGRRAADVVTSAGDQVTGIETVAAVIAGRGVLLDVGRAVGGGELPDGFAITAAHLDATIEAQGVSSRVGRGDIVVVRTGQLSRVRRDGWASTPEAPRRACRSPPPGGCTAARSPRSRRTPGGSRSGPTSSTTRFSPCTRSPSRTSACSSARCGTSTPSPATAPPTASTTSGSPPPPSPSPEPWAHPSTPSQ
jgi:hypothetical protein